MKNSIYSYAFNTKQGAVKLIFNPSNNRFHIVFNGEDLGNNHTAHAAASDAAGGHTFSHSSGISLGALGIPEDLLAWDRYIA